jgi:TonB family protein
VLYEMLTLDRLAAGSAIPGALAQATLKAAQEDAPIPEEILNFLKRLLMVGQPFGSAPEFNATLERVLYDGEYSPTTFNMAFLMHTLFREENEADALAMKNDQVTDFGPYAPQEAAQASPKAARSTNLPIYLLLGGIVVVLAAGIGGGVLWVQSINRQHQIEQRSMQARLAAIQRDKEAADAKLAEINKQEEAQKTLEELFGKQAEEATSSEARAAAKRDLEAAKQKRADLAKQRADALKEKQRLAQAGGGEEGSGLDVEPAVTQVGSPRVPNRASLPPSLQQSEVKVVLKVFVDAGGKPQKVVIVKGVEGNYGFNDSAQNAALASSFTPGRKNGKPAPGWLDMEINFGRPQ